MDLYIRPKNWLTVQQPAREGSKNYTEKPTWFRVYNALLSDRDWCHLTVDGRALLVTVWCLTARLGYGKVEADPRWVASQGSLQTVDIGELMAHGFVTLHDADGTLITEMPSALWGQKIGVESSLVEGLADSWTNRDLTLEDDLAQPCDSSRVPGNAHGESPGTFPPRKTRPDQITKTVVEQARRPNVDDGIWTAVWESYHGYHPKAKVSEKRRRMIRGRVKDGYDSETLLAAIEGNHRDPFCCGENKTGTEYHNFELIFRDGGQVEKYAAMLEKPAGRTIDLAERIRKAEAAMEEAG